MSKPKHAKPEEYYLGQIREQEKVIKKLLQKIKQLEKDLGYRQNNSPKKEKPPATKPDCPDCARGYLREIELANRIFDVCDICKYRSKLKRALKKRGKKS